jgi:glycosyltransferase involved in cell wall biosynthesis
MLSVILVSYNEGLYTAACVESIEQRYPGAPGQP